MTAIGNDGTNLYVEGNLYRDCAGTLQTVPKD